LIGRKNGMRAAKSPKPSMKRKGFLKTKEKEAGRRK